MKIQFHIQISTFVYLLWRLDIILGDCAFEKYWGRKLKSDLNEEVYYFIPNTSKVVLNIIDCERLCLYTHDRCCVAAMSTALPHNRYQCDLLAKIPTPFQEDLHTEITGQQVATADRISVKKQVSFDDCLHNSGPFGSVGGASWTHKDNYIANGTPREIMIARRPNNSYLTKLRVRYGDQWSDEQGIYVGTVDTDTFTLSDEEDIIRIEILVRSAQFITQLTFFTNKDNQFGPYGNGDGETYTASGPRLAYFSGGEGSLIDFLMFHWHPCFEC